MTYSVLKVPLNPNQPTLHLHCGWPHLSFALVFGIRKQVPTLSCGVVYVILRVPVLVEHRLVTDRQTDTTTAYSALA